MKREFLGWHKPLLHLTADYLIEHHTRDGRLDLSSVTLVLPGRRAVMRLEEILAERAQTMDDPAWYPPECLTLQSLPEKFYEMKKPIATEIAQWFAWINSVRKLHATDPGLLAPLLPELPTTFSAWITLGKMFATLHYELAAEGIDFKKVAQTHEATGLIGETPRWRTLSVLQDFYANADPKAPGFLDQYGLWDLQAARLYAIENQTPEERQRILRKLARHQHHFYLVGLVDMNILQKKILSQYDTFITALVFAPKNIQSRFDEFGCLCPDVWCDTPVEIDDEKIAIVWQPENEADAVLQKIASLQGQFATGEIIVGVPDKQVAPFIQERLAQAGLPARLIEGTPIRRTIVFRFLDVLLKFLKSRLFRDYAELVRHPDVETLIRKSVDEDFISQLDDYHNTFFPVRVDDHWKNDAKHPRKFQAIPLVWEQVKQLIDVPFSSKIPQKENAEHWLLKIDEIMDRLYTEEQNDQLRAAIDIVKRTTGELRSLPAGFPQQLTFAELFELLMTQIEAEPLPPQEMPNAVELLGWLDLPMDDTPIAIVTGMNDGTVPSFANSDIFLPDALRKELGIMDNRRRCARDAYALCVLLETRKNCGDVLLVAGRRSSDGDPLLPSRFFFMAENAEKTVRRVHDFFAEMKPDTAVRLKRSLQPGRESEHDFHVPLLPELANPIKSFTVTELSDYLLCPYRYYLNRFCGLRKKDDSAEELQYSDFGTLVHEILRQFGRHGSPVRDSDSSRQIGKFLDASLDDYVEKIYGNSPPATIAVQIARVRNRLHAFADWQADWRRQGYEIADVEFSPTGNRRVTIAEKPLFGRIDRIDRHPTKREIVVFDYKTGKDAPSSAYLVKKAQWKDFQLPLYYEILRRSGYAPADFEIRLAYLSIPADLRELGPQWVNWNEEIIQSGISCAEEIAREILATDWTKVCPSVLPSDKQRYDEFAYICMSDLRQVSALTLTGPNNKYDCIDPNDFGKAYLH